ncbi:signal peptidase II [Desulfobaculum senezii]|jgi:signal peptidase II|uniref:signal peptidase II n=1 Tax=Desulfobaculum sp. SPO524 TaxID=3378071 RepID=UPI003853FC92
MRNRYAMALSIAGSVLILDQLTKLWVQATIPPWQGYAVIPGFFNMVHVLNKGAAFGFLDTDAIAWQTTLFITVALVAVGAIMYLLKTAHFTDKLSVSALGLILGGALGNLVDRVHLGAVVDFLDFHYKAWHWPAFNVADIGICLGVGLMLITIVKSDTAS